MVVLPMDNTQCPNGSALLPEAQTPMLAWSSPLPQVAQLLLHPSVWSVPVHANLNDKDDNYVIIKNDGKLNATQIWQNNGNSNSINSLNIHPMIHSVHNIVNSINYSSTMIAGCCVL
jgi:hypothetical protein